MEREACVCDHGFERSDLCAEKINNNNNNAKIFRALLGKITTVKYRVFFRGNW